MNFSKSVICWLFGILILCSCASKKITLSETKYTQFVNPLIGSGGHGHVFVGASVPHGMVQIGPNNLSKGWDWCSGYHDSDSTIIGFAQSHLSGTGIADLGDVIFMPVTGIQTSALHDTVSFAKSYVSKFKKHHQKVVPGYYSVMLDRYDIKAEMTATERVSFQKYSYPENSSAIVIVNLHESVQSLMARKGALMAEIKVLNDSTISGYRWSDEWAKDHRVYFTTVFSKPILKNYFISGSKIIDTKTLKTNPLNGVFEFKNDGKPLLVKTGISYVSEAGAALNLISEIPHWNFDQIKNDALLKWEKSLSSYDFKSKDASTVSNFYTALYHTQISPSLFNDVDGKYRGADSKIYTEKSYDTYTVFSLWDTYRAVHPLYTLTDLKVKDYANSLLSINQQQKRMPVWHLVGNETDCMVGVHSIPVVIDAYLKGFDVNKGKIWDAVKDFDDYKIYGLKEIKEYGYIPADKEVWSVAKGLEYAIDNYSISRFANNIGYISESKKYFDLSKGYQHYFDGTKGFMRGKLSDGSRRPGFNPSYSVHLEDDYVEGNAWQYTWLVPHDVEGLVKLFGGEEKFINKLDSLFTVSSELNEGASVDITGMIGQYAHGNEPSHHILYLYPYVGQQWKTAERVREVMGKFYKNEVDGLIGNEDCGQMSAWYIFSSLGFYPVNPVNGSFVIGSPIADEATIKLNNGKSFTIKSVNNSSENKYIQSVKLNGKEYPYSYITYQDIMKGGDMTYIMGKNPNYNYGKAKLNRPTSEFKQPNN